MNGTSEPATVHRYRVRFPDTAAARDPLVETQVLVRVDLGTRSATLDLPGRPPVTVDVVTARALHMLLGAAVFTSLRPTGPRLSVEADTGGGWPADPTGEE